MSEKNIASIVHEAVAKFCHERAEKEQRGYAQAAWFEQEGLNQIQERLTEKRFVEWLKKAYSLGYEMDDVVVAPYISTHGVWYGWTSFQVEVPVYGRYSTSFGKIEFPHDSELPKTFVMPFLEREAAEAEERETARAEREAADATAKAVKEANRKNWIFERGSDYLRRATALGYNCQRQYVTERAALEFPGFELDFDDQACWKSRNCPSEAALVEVEVLIEAGHNAEVVWLTEPVVTTRDDDGYPEPFDPCEAIVIKYYLGKYDLLKVI